jgi:hypothetical protein
MAGIEAAGDHADKLNKTIDAVQKWVPWGMGVPFMQLERSNRDGRCTALSSRLRASNYQ